MSSCSATRRSIATLGCIVLLAVVPSDGELYAQAPSSPRATAEAARLLAEGDVAGARRTLEIRLGEEPADLDARRLLARLLYDASAIDSARAVYEAGLARHPESWALRIDLGRMLVETNVRREARAVLAPLTQIPNARADAESLLGTLDYWSGDFTTARARFAAALDADPSHPDARRQLDEIDAASRPWLAVGSQFRRDDQPITSAAGELELGWYATPLWALSARVRPARHAPDRGGAVTLASAEVGMTHFAPRLRVDTEVAVGALQRSFGATSDWTGRAALGVRLPGHVTARVSGVRAPYLYTLASLVTPVIAETVTGALRLDHPRGWLGEAAVQRERYPDANVVGTGYAWILAPVVRARRGDLQVGYSIAAQDARETRFVASSGTPGPGGRPTSDAGGRYAPYFTPERLRSQSVILAGVLRPGQRVELRLGGSYAISASDEAPVFVAGAGVPPVSPVLTFMRRSFTPWDVRAALSSALTPAVHLSLTAEHATMAFFEVNTLGARLTYRFASRSIGTSE